MAARVTDRCALSLFYSLMRSSVFLVLFFWCGVHPKQSTRETNFILSRLKSSRPQIIEPRGSSSGVIVPPHPKCFIHNSVVEITSRVEEGLPFIATSYMRLILESSLARAQQLFPVRLIANVFLANHFHMLVILEDPELLSSFVGYFKKETAHAVNSLLGREKHTVWAEGYDSPIVLDSEKVLERLVYYFTNPQTSRLENTIELYPQLNSWVQFLEGKTTSKMIPTFPRTAVPRFEGNSEDKIYKMILSDTYGEAELVIEPFAWLSVFPETENTSPERIIEEVQKQVRSKEQLLRLEKGDSVVGAEALRTQDMRRSHQPKKRGKKSICLGSVRAKRREFVAWFFEEAKLARKAISNWKKNGGPLILPPGFFAPGGRLCANVFPEFLRA